VRVARWVRKANRRRKAEDSIPLRVAVGVAVVASATAVLRQGIGGPVLFAVAVAGLPMAFVFSWWTRHRPGFMVKALLAIGVVVAFAMFLRQVTSTGPANLAGMQTPLAELFVWVQLLHAFDVPARRDLMFSLASSLVLVAMAAVFALSMMLALHLLVWAGAALSALVLAHRSELSELDPLTQIVDVGGAGTGAASLPSVWRLVATAGAGCLLAAVAVFVVLPRSHSQRGIAFPSQLAERVPVPNLGGLSNPSLGAADPAFGDGGGSGGAAAFGYFGFSRNLDTSVRGRPDDTVVMRVRASAPELWRGQTFDSWDGRSWTQSEDDDRVRPVRGPSPLELPIRYEDGVPAAGAELTQTFYLEESGPNLIFAAYQARVLHFADNAVFQMSDGTIRSGVGLGRGAVYTVVSSRPAVTPDLLRRSEAEFASSSQRERAALLPRQLRERYTQVPDSTPQRVLDLAADLTRGAPTTYDKVSAIEGWLGEHTEYSLDIPPLPAGEDAVDRYLFVDRKGFCEQIGTALVVMLRSQGIPARLVAGYAPGERNPFTGMFDVKASDAHAWAEVYFPGVGWQGFDPTAEVPLAGESGPSEAAGLWHWVARRLSPPVWVSAAATVAACALLFGLSRLLRRRRARRNAPAPSWARVQVRRLEAAGGTAGRPRAPSDTVESYAGRLVSAGLCDDRLLSAAAVLDASAFGAGEPQQDQRELVEAAVGTCEARAAGRSPNAKAGRQRAQP